jgi:hypothetical protein
MNLALILAQLYSANCTFQIFKYRPRYKRYELESNSDYFDSSLRDLMEIKVIKFEISEDFPESIVYDIYI